MSQPATNGPNLEAQMANLDINSRGGGGGRNYGPQGNYVPPHVRQQEYGRGRGQYMSGPPPPAYGGAPMTGPNGELRYGGPPPGHMPHPGPPMGPPMNQPYRHNRGGFQNGMIRGPPPRFTNDRGYGGRDGGYRGYSDRGYNNRGGYNRGFDRGFQGG